MPRSFLFLIALAALGLASLSANLSAEPAKASLKERLHKGEVFVIVRVPTGESREQVHALIKEQHPDMLYLEAFSETLLVFWFIGAHSLFASTTRLCMLIDTLNCRIIEQSTFA